MSDVRVHDVLRDRGAIREGHFVLSSGRHSDVYVEKARVFEDPEVTMALARQIAGWYRDIDVVVSPAVGAVPLGFAVALASGARFVYAEREGGRMILRRGFRLSPGERTVVVEDVVTTGGSAAEVWDLVGAAGAERLGVAALVDRSSSRPPAHPGDVPFPLRSLVRIEAASFDPEQCPLCSRGVPTESPGSRQLA